jgi:shikimate kinase
MRIYLIGFMGSGKTHWGKRLSHKTGMPFYDLDEEIVKTEEKSVQQIFHDKGEEYFREKERDLLADITFDHPSLILSCGGGTPCFFNNIDFMKQHGTIIWLNTAVDILVHRLLKEKSHRPVIKNVSDADLKSFIIKKLQDRKLYYEQADVMLHEESITIDSLLKIIPDA